MRQDFIPSPTAKPKALVAMSGGVDSSVAAALLQREGYEVVGCFMRLGSPGESLEGLVRADEEPGATCEKTAPGGRTHTGKTLSLAQAPSTAPVKIGHQGCCSINDAADARLVAAKLGIPLYVCNFKKDFGRIIDYFVGEYAAGRTPNPCVRCNDWLKFGKLHEYAEQIGAGFVASGHYARIRTGADARCPSDRVTQRQSANGGGAYALLRGVDATKDQSYVLFGMPRAQLARTLFPIGHLPKSEVRALAAEIGLPVFDKPDSQEICFVPDNNYAGLVSRSRPDLVREGNIVNTSGETLGEHRGQHHFTIGQRRGLAVAMGKRMYVVSKDAATNTVVVGEAADLLRSSCAVREANWLVDAPAVGEEIRVLAKYRYNTPAVAGVAMVTEHSDGGLGPAGDSYSGRLAVFEVRFDEPQVAVAPGQALVLYDANNPDRVLGGGWIASCRTPACGAE